MASQLRPGYGIVHRCVMENQSISRDSKALYALIQSYTGGSETCFPSIPTLAKCLCCTKMSVINWIEELEKNDLLSVKREQGKVNIYRPLVPEPVNQGLPPSQPALTGTSQPALTLRLTTKKNKKNNVSDASRKHIIGLYINLYKEKAGGSEPTIDGCTIGCIDSLLSKRKEDEIVMVLDRYFKNGFYYTKSGFSFKNMFYHYDEILSSIPQKQEDKEEDYRCPSCGKKPTGHRSGAPFCFKCSMNCVEVMV